MTQVDSFISIRYWMISELHLKGHERDIYAIIYGFCQNDEYHKISLSYFCEWSKASLRCVKYAIKKLVEKKLIRVRVVPGKSSYYNIVPEQITDAIARGVKKQEVEKLVAATPKDDTIPKNDAIVKEAIKQTKADLEEAGINEQCRKYGLTREQLRKQIIGTDWTYHGRK